MFRMLYFFIPIVSAVYVAGCTPAKPASSLPTASLLQRVIGSPGKSEGEIRSAYDLLADQTAQEDAATWIAQSGDENLSTVARGLSFQAFWCRFVHTPIGLRSLVQQYHLEQLLNRSRLIDANRTDAYPFDTMTLPSGHMGGLCIWCAPDGINDREFGVFLKLSRAVTPQQLIRIVSDRNIQENIFILEFSTLAGCPNPPKDK